jgi:DNA ligase (NAD+)
MIAKSLRSYFSNQSYLLEIEKLRAIGLNFKSEVIDKSGNKLVGFSFVISGVFDFFSRDEIKKSVEDNGGKIVSSVSSKTDYLLMGSGVGPSKIKKADLHGVKRLTENEFLRWVGSSK